jgi:hypothetical protein
MGVLSAIDAELTKVQHRVSPEDWAIDDAYRESMRLEFGIDHPKTPKRDT